MPSLAPHGLTVDPSASMRCLPMLIWAEGIDVSAALPRPDWLAAALATAESGQNPAPEGTRELVREMLRHGTYKPSGRAKPASEYLLAAATRGEFPVVNGPVDVNNAISLASGIPGSIFDSGLAGGSLLLRHGRPGESYVFNRSGQSIDLEDLLVVCRKVSGTWEPCGNPVKDAMTTKVRPESHGVVAVLYAPRSLGSTFATHWAERFATLLEVACQAQAAGVCDPVEGSET